MVKRNVLSHLQCKLRDFEFLILIFLLFYLNLKTPENTLLSAHFVIENEDFCENFQLILLQFLSYKLPLSF